MNGHDINLQCAFCGLAAFFSCPYVALVVPMAIAWAKRQKNNQKDKTWKPFDDLDEIRLVQ